MNINPETKKLLVALAEMEKPEIILRGEVDHNMEEYVFWAFALFRSRKNPEVIITIDSGGGNADDGHDIYDMIKSYPGKTIGRGFCGVHSAASFIMQACTERTMAYHAKMKIHNPSRQSVSLDVLNSPTRLKKLKKDLAGYQSKLIRAYVLRSKKTEKEIIKQLARDESLTATQALEMGLIDKIIGED